MTRLLSGLALTLPDGFAEVPAERGARFDGPGGEVLTVQVASLADQGSGSQQTLVRDRLVQGAIKDIQRDGCQADLEILVPLSRAPGRPGVETWNLVSRSASGRLLAQAVVATDAAVAILACDGRNERATIGRWFQLLESIAPADPTAT